MINRKNEYSRILWICVGGLVAIYITVFIQACLCKYLNFIYNDWDLAIYNQLFRGLVNGKPYTSIGDLPFLGVHVGITMALFVPIYALFQHPTTLLIIQSIMLGLGAIPLFLIARKILSGTWGLIFVFIYLLYPAIGYTNLNEFHPESFLPFIQFFLFYFFIKDDFKKFSIFMFLCLFAKENMSLIVIMIGFYALIKRKKNNWVILPIVSGIIWFWFYLNVLFPNLSAGKTQFYEYYGHLGQNLSQIIWSIIIHPVMTLKLMAMPHKLNYLINLFGPLSFLSLANPLVLLITFPNFLQHLVSSRTTEVSLSFYYPCEVLAFIFISAVYGLDSLLRSRFFIIHKNILAIIILSVALFFNVKLGPQIYMLRQIKSSCIKTELVAIKNDFINMIPEGSSVVSTFEFLPKLSNVTDRLYSFHRVILGKYNKKRDFILPEDVEFALIDFNDRYTFYNFFSPVTGNKNLKNFFDEGHWEPVEAIENIVLFKKNYNGNFSLYSLDQAVTGENLTKLTFDDNIELISYRIENDILKIGDKIKLSFFWRSLKNMDKDYWLYVMVLDLDGEVVYRTAHPFCYRIYPTNTWKEKEIIREEYRIPIPGYVDQGSYQLYIGLFDSFTKEFSVVSSDTIGIKNNFWVSLTDFQVK